MLRNSATHWGWPAWGIHWIMVAMILGQWWLGQWMTGIGNDRLQEKFELYQLHKSIGLTILALALLRLVWRTVSPPPQWPSTMPDWERMAARVSHLGFYVLMVLVPLTGFLMAAASPLGIPTTWFGLISVPHPLGPDKETEDLFKGMHAVLASLLLALIIIHAAAALKHEFWDRDDVLRRMLYPRG